MLKLTEVWKQYLRGQPETGMGYQVATVELKDGRVFERVLIMDDAIQEIDHSDQIPFTEVADIAAIKVQSGLGNGPRY